MNCNLFSLLTVPPVWWCVGHVIIIVIILILIIIIITTTTSNISSHVPRTQTTLWGAGGGY